MERKASKRAATKNLFLTFQADKEDSPQESQATPSKSSAHNSDESDAIALFVLALRGRDRMRSLAVRVDWPAK